MFESAGQEINRIAQSNPPRGWEEARAKSVTFIVTEDCQLRCKYCYLVGKNDARRMGFDIARRTVDYLLSDRETFHEPSVIWEFIGGEPFLEIDLMDQITDYIKRRMYEESHPWFSSYRFNTTTNGLLYGDERVQRWIAKNRTHLSLGFSLDGIREKHNAQRVYPDGRGSYDDVVRALPLWLEQFPEAQTKSTVGREDLPYIKDSVLHLFGLGLRAVHMNVVFESVWQKGDAEVFEAQLRSLADAIIEQELYVDHHVSLFSELIGRPMPATEDLNWCGAGKMLAVDADGSFYPCLRFASYSLSNRPGWVIGDCFRGVDANRLRPFLTLSRSSQSPPECMVCEVASGCAWCSGCNYDLADTPTVYQRSIAMCEMHKARVRANEYFWDRLRRRLDVGPTQPGAPPAAIGPVEEEVGVPLAASTLPMEPETVRRLVVLLDAAAPSFCYYRPAGPAPRGTQMMSPDTLARALGYAEAHGLSVTVLYGDHALEPEHQRLLAQAPHAAVVPHGRPAEAACGAAVVVLDAAETPLPDGGQAPAGGNLILRVAKAQLGELSELVTRLLGRCERLNLCLVGVDQWSDSDMDGYEEALGGIAEHMVAEYQRGHAAELNVLTDRLLLTGMNNCDAGVTHVTLAPDGGFYLCPGFYYEGKAEAVGNLEEGLQIRNPRLLRVDHAPICSRCDAYHCKRCVYLNRRTTAELNTPSRQQCVVAHIEREASRRLLERLRPIPGLATLPAIPSVSHRDPFVVAGGLARGGYDPPRDTTPRSEWRERLGGLSTDELAALADDVAQAILDREPATR